MTSFIIIGAGNFGASTALALAQRGHENVTIIDTALFPNPRAASHDINKIVRDDYPDLLYMRMMSEAMSKWRKDPLYSRFYHEVGLLRVDASDFGKESMASYRNLGIGNRCQLLPVEDVRFAGIPILKNCLPQVKGEGMSMLPDGTIKFNCDMCFTNYVTCPSTGERISMAPDQKVFNQWTGPKFISILQERARQTMNGLYGKEVEEISIDEYRICWDASTPTHDFLITPHPHSQGLYVATGGSFHGWKFLPVLGEYIANMMQGLLETEYADRWAWDQKGRDGQSANPTYQVVGDLQDWIA